MILHLGNSPLPHRESMRTLLLGATALVLVALTIFEYTAGKPGGNDSDPARPAASGDERLAEKWDKIARLRYYRDNAPVIRQRYATIAVPYAESIAGFAALHPPGADAKSVAEQAVRDLLPAGVELKDILLAEAAKPVAGIVWLTATVSLASGDSQALSAALLALGNAGNGMIWKELSLGVDTANRRIQAKGELTLIAIEQAE
jgi:hypothetical protein